MDHFKGINDTERYQNELLREIKRGNELLERIAQALQPSSLNDAEKTKRTYQRRKTS